MLVDVVEQGPRFLVGLAIAEGSWLEAAWRSLEHVLEKLKIP